MMLQRGIVVSHETICNGAANLRQRAASLSVPARRYVASRRGIPHDRTISGSTWAPLTKTGMSWTFWSPLSGTPRWRPDSFASCSRCGCRIGHPRHATWRAGQRGLLRCAQPPTGSHNRRCTSNDLDTNRSVDSSKHPTMIYAHAAHEERSSKRCIEFPSPTPSQPVILSLAYILFPSGPRMTIRVMHSWSGVRVRHGLAVAVLGRLVRGAYCTSGLVDGDALEPAAGAGVSGPEGFAAMDNNIVVHD